MSRFAWKVDAGACFAMTQPVFSLEQLDSGLEKLTPFGLPIIVGVWPLTSLRNTEFLANEVPGVTVPDEVIARMRAAAATGDDAARSTGIEIASEMVAAIRGRVAGVQVAAPGGKVEGVLQILQET